MAINIVELAKENSEVINIMYQQLTSTPDETCQEFIQHLEESLAASICMNHQSFVSTLEKQCIESEYERIGDYEATKAEYGNRRDYRVKVDEAFEKGVHFKYLSLNSGNLGLPIWGHYSLIFELRNFEEDSTVILMRNSLERDTKTESYYYFDKEEQLNIELFKYELALLSDVRKVPLIKHHYKIHSSSKNEWPDVICKNASSFVEGVDYIELITNSKVNLEVNPFKLRMKEKDAEKFFEFTLKHLGKGQIEDLWLVTGEELTELIQLYAKYNFEIETVDI